MNGGLAVDDLSAGYTVVPVVRHVTLHVAPGELVALLGPNGAGKTTLLRTIAGLLPPAAGRIVFASRAVTDTSIAERVRLGIVLVAEGRRLFTDMTVEDNLRMGAFVARDRREVQRRMDEVYGVFPRLRERRRTPAGNLSGGEQQMCAIGTGLMGAPQLLLVDELSLGLAPHLVESLAETLRVLSARGMAVLLVDQAVDVALEVATRAYVMEGGQIRLHGASDTLRASPAVRESYLGSLRDMSATADVITPAPPTQEEPR